MSSESDGKQETQSGELSEQRAEYGRSEPERLALARLKAELERWPSEVVRLKAFFERWRIREDGPQQEWKTPSVTLFGKKW